MQESGVFIQACYVSPSCSDRSTTNGGRPMFCRLFCDGRLRCFRTATGCAVCISPHRPSRQRELRVRLLSIAKGKKQLRSLHRLPRAPGPGPQAPGPGPGPRARCSRRLVVGQYRRGPKSRILGSRILVIRPLGAGLNRPATITLYQCLPQNNGHFPDAAAKAR